MEREYVHKEELDKYIIHLTDEQYRQVIEFAQQDINKEWEDKIREKIKELEQERDEEHDAGDFTKIFEHEQDLQLCIDTLQELLEE